MAKCIGPSFSAQFLHSYRPQALGDVVDSIWDWDIPDGDTARALTFRKAPSTSLLLIAAYRSPVYSQQKESALPAKFATQIRGAPVTLRPTGPLGVIVVAIKPEATRRIIDEPFGDFSNANLLLADLFGQGETAACDEMLAAAHTSAERVATVEAFLLRRLRPASLSIAGHVALRLRHNPMLRMGDLAAEIGTSPRHLGRTFRAAFATSPKYFARLARVERMIGLRQQGFAWADIAYACGLADQAHLVREFKALVGECPTDFFAGPPHCWVPGTADSGPFIVPPPNGEVRKLQALHVSHG